MKNILLLACSVILSLFTLPSALSARTPAKSGWVPLINGKDLTGWKNKGEKGGNSGVFVHARIIGIDPTHGPDIEGMQVEVDPNVGNHTGGLYESGGRGWVIQPTAEGERGLKPIGQWNDLEMSVRGNHIVTRLNGVRIVDYTDSAPKFTDGVIALQIHTGGGVRVRWKDIYVQETGQ